MILTIVIATIVLFLIVLIWRIIYYNCNSTYSYKKIKFNNSSLSTDISANWYIGDNNRALFPENNFTTNKIGIAFSGGGSRAMCSCWGVLKSLYRNGLLNKDKIGYLSGVSGSTWALFSLLFEPIEGSKYTIDDILGSTTIDYSKDIKFPLMGYNPVNGKFNIENNDKWWPFNVGKVFFNPYGIANAFNSSTGIVGINKLDIIDILDKLDPSYNGILLRKDMPIPIAMHTLVDILETPWYELNIYNAVPMDTSPISTGFLCNNLTINSSKCSDLKSIGGRTDTFVFNSVLSKNVKTSDVSGIYEISVNLSDTTWDLTQISGASSMAPGFDVLKDTASLLDSLVPNYLIQTPNAIPRGKNVKIVDGGTWDNTGVTSLLARQVKKVVVFIFSDYLPSEWTLTYGTEDLSNLFGEPNSFYPDYHSQKAAQVLSNSNNEYEKTITGIINNYKTTGIACYQDIYQTVTNKISGVTPYNVSIMWYVLSPCQPFLNTLTKTELQSLSSVKRFPNICTSLPFTNDCSDNINCVDECPPYTASELFEIFKNSTDINRITNKEALFLCGQMEYITDNTIVQFLMKE